MFDAFRMASSATALIMLLIQAPTEPTATIPSAPANQNALVTLPIADTGKRAAARSQGGFMSPKIREPVPGGCPSPRARWASAGQVLTEKMASSRLIGDKAIGAVGPNMGKPAEGGVALPRKCSPLAPTIRL